MDPHNPVAWVPLCLFNAFILTMGRYVLIFPLHREAKGLAQSHTGSLWQRRLQFFGYCPNQWIILVLCPQSQCTWYPDSLSSTTLSPHCTAWVLFSNTLSPVQGCFENHRHFPQRPCGCFWFTFPGNVFSCMFSHDTTATDLSDLARRSHQRST